jgi:hypothetical protein
MPGQVISALPLGPEPSTTALVVSAISLVLLAGVLVADILALRTSRRLARDLHLPKGQWLRRVSSLPFDPAIELLVVGLLLGQDLVENWEHAVAGAIGAAIGLLVGRYRSRLQYVRSVPDLRAVVLVRSREEYVALAVLALVRIASEQHEIPVVGPLTLLITAGLAIVVAESIGRAWFIYLRYAHDTAHG